MVWNEDRSMGMKHLCHWSHTHMQTHTQGIVYSMLKTKVSMGYIIHRSSDQFSSEEMQMIFSAKDYLKPDTILNEQIFLRWFNYS